MAWTMACPAASLAQKRGLLLFSNFLGFGSGLYHMPDHSTGLEAVGFLSFPSEPSLVAKPLLVATEPPLASAEPPLAAKPCELDLQENFEEDCCYLLSCLGNVYVISFQASSMFYALFKTALILVNLQPSNSMEMLDFSNLVNFTILLLVGVFALIQSLKIQW